MAQVVVSRTAEQVAVVRLARPQKLNALNMAMFREIRATAQSLAQDTSVRAVVVHGEGRAFCSGLDIKSMMSAPMANTAELLRKDGTTNLAQDASYLWRKVPVPVIAAVHGVCFGGGLQIALGADMTVAAPATKFSVMEAKWGLIPDMAISVSLPDGARKDRVLEVTLTGRAFDAEEARDLGLVTKISEDPLDAALDIAKQIASNSPDAVAAGKRLVEASFDERLLTLETDLQRRLLGGWNQLSKTASSMQVPLVPGFLARSAQWSQDADDAAEQRLLADFL